VLGPLTGEDASPRLRRAIARGGSGGCRSESWQRVQRLRASPADPPAARARPARGFVRTTWPTTPGQTAVDGGPAGDL